MEVTSPPALAAAAAETWRAERARRRKRFALGRARRVVRRALRAGLAVLERRDRRLQLAGALLRASLIPQLLELGVVVRIHGRLRGGRATAFVERFAEARLGNAGRHGWR